jgi:hypothetical protein
VTSSNLNSIPAVREESVDRTREPAAEIPLAHSRLQSILLHLLPGVLTGVLVFSLRGLVQAAGYPTLLSLIVAIPLVLMPVELGILYFQGGSTTAGFLWTGSCCTGTPFWPGSIL